MVSALFRDFQSRLEHFFSSVSSVEIEKLVEKLISCSGTVFLTGLGKSGHIARKVAATLVSTGTRALFLSPDHALHGDIGMVCPQDACLFFSKSGESEELLGLMRHIRKKGARTVSVVCVCDSRLGKEADDLIYLPISRELCPYDLAPTVSTAAQLIFGDCLAIALMQAKRFTIEDFASNHPGGMLGRKITLRVSDLMRQGKDLPICEPNQQLIHVLHLLSEKRCGCLLISKEEKLLGIFTDGDLRRSIEKMGERALRLPMQELMSRSPRTVISDALALTALREMEQDKNQLIMVLPVVEDGRLIGLLRMHDILQEGLR